MTYANDRAATDLEVAEALDIDTRRRMAQVIVSRIDQILNDPDFCLDEVPATSAEQATDEEGEKAATARPASDPSLSGCDWLRQEGVLRELPN